MDDVMTPRPGALATLRRKPWIAIGLAVFVLFALWVKSTRTQPHHLRVGFATAVNVVSGLDVQIDGIDAGKISKVDYVDGRPVVEIGINDDRWPLREGTTATIRFGTTVGNGTRRVDLNPGPPNAPELPDGGVIPGKAAVSPVEFDQVFNMLDKEARGNLRSMLGNTAESFSGHEKDMASGWEESAKGMAAVQALVGDLAEDTHALRGLVVNGHRTTRALAAQRSQITSLVRVAGATFDEFARRSTAMKSSLDELPPTLQSVRGTLRRLDTSVDGLDPLLADLGPGARQLRALAPVARSAIGRIREQAPLATAAVSSLRAAAPDASRFLTEAVPVMSGLDDVLEELAPMVACLRPYAPELAGAMNTWASWSKNYDGIAHFARVKVTASPYALNATPDLTTSDYVKALPMVTYAMPRPPGLNAGKPHFMPECGVGPDSLDPSKDPEDTARPGNTTTRSESSDGKDTGSDPGATSPMGLDAGLDRLVTPFIAGILEGAAKR